MPAASESRRSLRLNHSGSPGAIDRGVIGLRRTGLANSGVRRGVHDPRTAEHFSYCSETGKGDESSQLAKVLDAPPLSFRLKILFPQGSTGSSPVSGTMGDSAARKTRVRFVPSLPRSRPFSSVRDSPLHHRFDQDRFSPGDAVPAGSLRSGAASGFRFLRPRPC
jgi:hypothetical protein